MRIAIIIDGYSTAVHYAKNFNKKGLRCVHVQSSVFLPSFIAAELIKEDYVKTFVYSKDIEDEILSRVRDLGEIIIIDVVECILIERVQTYLIRTLWLYDVFIFIQFGWNALVKPPNSTITANEFAE